ncbi:N(4)-(Beta-N-acetylglucosaminyl)-L-asparaginase [Orchesella cincta]|uniref:N(4)-(beta-N-acetylglucosaminyl)-L-asparaginase n=1 Tax=Orchesella cincta TaxID=48709 RepID=A0A1D2MM47_ORCCI|nr:N(4)-(Beta-N-acetylglucosaminyl)-L-asparaginase [Orchesella cincta]
MKDIGRFHVIIAHLFFLSTLLLLCNGARGLAKFNKPPFQTVRNVAHFEDNEIETDQQDSSRKSMTMLASSEDNEKKSEKVQNALPVVINTWRFTESAQTAWNILATGGNALDAVERGCTRCEELQCDTTVGYVSSPDENGETTLDAMIMDGETHAVGAVGCLRKVKNAISVARKVMEHTKHTLLVGELATDFAAKMGFTLESLETDESLQMHNDWKENKCQPNFWKNVTPDPATNCGPYRPIPSSSISTISTKKEESRPKIDEFNHDTIGMVVIDANGRIASGTSSNGARNKIPGRVGDAPITGAGSYVDKEVGGAACTGDGDIMARFLPSLLTVEEMRRGATPEIAARFAISRIAKYYPSFSGGIVAVNLQGEIGAACHNLPNGFPFSYVQPESPDVKVDVVQCTSK